MNYDRYKSQKTGFFSSRSNVVLLVFLLIAGFYLITEHQAHLLGALPWLILLACPLLHLFMHGGHGGHGGHESHHTHENNLEREDGDNRE